jgi:hypothetical protein
MKDKQAVTIYKTDGTVLHTSTEVDSIKKLAEKKRANLQEADLRDADLQEANLWRADLRKANLQEADLRDADLQEANLWGANLRRTNLRRTNLWKADLRKAKLWKAKLWKADLWDADLWGAKIKKSQMPQLLEALGVEVEEDCELIGDKVLEKVGLVDIGIKDGCGQPMLMQAIDPKNDLENMKSIAELIIEISKETTPKGNRLLDELIEALLKELDKLKIILK